MKDLKKNEFIVRLKTALQNYPAISESENTLSKGKSAFDKYPVCDAHFEVLTLMCEDCNSLLCSFCFTLNHKNHNIKHISEYFDLLKTNMEQILKNKQERANIILNNYKVSEYRLSKNETIACGLKEQIKKRGNILKTVIDSVIDDLIKNVDLSWTECSEEAGNVVLELKNMETLLQEEMETLKQQITDLDYSNFIKTYSAVMDKEMFIPCYSEDFAAYFHVNDNCNKDFEKAIGTLEIVPKMKLVKEEKLRMNAQSLASCQDGIFVCYKNSAKVDAFSYEGSTWRSSCEFENIVTAIYDMLVFNNKLILVGGSDQRNGCKVNKILKIGLPLKGEPSEIYEFPSRGYLPRLSTTSCGNILSVLDNNLLHLSENGVVIKKVDLQFNITNALQTSDHQYVVCRLFGDICIINDFGDVLLKYSPSKEWHKIRSPICLARDHCGYVYVSSHPWPVTHENRDKEKVCVLGRGLNFVWSYEVKGYLNKIYFNELNKKLLILLRFKETSTLMTFDI